MAQILTVDLRGRVEGGHGIEFLRAELNGSEATPFALVRYALNGEEQRSGFRIDVDKAAFIDRPSDPEQEAVIVRAAPAIVDLLSPTLNLREIKLFRTGALAVLSEAEQDVLLRILLYAQTERQIADELGVPVQTVRIRYRDALVRLQKFIDSDPSSSHTTTESAGTQSAEVSPA